MNDGGAAILILVYLATVLVVLWLLFATVWRMAEKRGHNPWGWLFISLCWSPVGSIIVMWVFFPILDVEK